MTFVVNQPPAHPQLPLSGCDKHVSLSQTATLYVVSALEKYVQHFFGSGHV